MARQLRIEYPGAFYHIIQRGNEKRDIFLSNQDREKFYEYIKEIHSRYAVKIHTYCLMNNHYHLILETKEANLTKTMHSLNTSYPVYFNTKREKTGHLFQGRYKAILVEADGYLHHLSRYIHLNPVRINLVKDPMDYPHSSYKYFVSDVAPPDWLETSFILAMFDKNIKTAKSIYNRFVVESIGKEQPIIKDNITAGFLLGSQSFIKEIKEKFIQDKIDKEIPVINKLKNRPTCNDIRDIVEKMIGDEKLSRNISIYLIRKYTSHSLKEIAMLYNMSDAGVSALYNRFEKKRIEDKEIDKNIIEIENLWKIEI